MTAPSARPGLDRAEQATVDLKLALDRMRRAAYVARDYVDGDPLPDDVVFVLHEAIDATIEALPAYQSQGAEAPTDPPVWEWARLDELKVGDRIQYEHASVAVGPWTTVSQVITSPGRTKVWCEELSTIFANAGSGLVVRRQVAGTPAEDEEIVQHRSAAVAAHFRNLRAAIEKSEAEIAAGELPSDHLQDGPRSWAVAAILAEQRSGAPSESVYAKAQAHYRAQVAGLEEQREARHAATLDRDGGEA